MKHWQPLLIACVFMFVFILTACSRKVVIFETAEPLSYVFSEASIFDGLDMVAETDTLALHVSQSGAFMLENKASGMSYLSSPSEDELSGLRGPQKNRTLSLFTATVLNTTEEIETIVYSSLLKELPQIAEISNGWAFKYNVTNSISVVIEIALDGDCLSVRIPMGGIEESGEELLKDIQILPGFSAGLKGDEGFMLIPDGCGAIVNFGLPAGTYNEPVYGSDKAFIKEALVTNKEQIAIPVYGIVNNGEGALAVISQGDAHASIRAQSGGTLNAVYPSFSLRQEDTIKITSGVEQVVYEENRLFGGVCEVRIYPSGEDYMALADTFKRYLMTEKGMQPLTETGAATFINIHSAYDNGNSVDILTDYKEAAEIMDQINTAYAGRTILVLSEWESAGTKGKITENPDALGILGGKSELDKLIKACALSNTKLFGFINEAEFTSGTDKGDAVRTLAGEPAAQFNYSLAGYTAYQDLAWYYLKPGEVKKKALAVTERFPFDGVAFTSIGDVLYSDFSAGEPMSRQMAEKQFTETLEMVRDRGQVLTKGGHLYAATESDIIIDLPNSASGFKFEKKAIPFYQIALSGLTYYASRPINTSADPNYELLFALQTGSLLHFDITANIPDQYSDFYANKGYTYWKEYILAEGARASNIAAQVAGAGIMSFEEVSPGIISTGFANGITVTVDYNTGKYSSRGETE